MKNVKCGISLPLLAQLEEDLSAGKPVSCSDLGCGKGLVTSAGLSVLLSSQIVVPWVCGIGAVCVS